MFDDINLLPKDLRKREADERREQDRSTFKVEESQINLPSANPEAEIDFKKNAREKKDLPEWLKVSQKSQWDKPLADQLAKPSFFSKMKTLINKPPRPDQEISVQETKDIKSEIKPEDRRPILPKTDLSKIAGPESLANNYPVVKAESEKINLAGAAQATEPSAKPPAKKSFFGWFGKKSGEIPEKSQYIPAPPKKNGQFSQGDKLAAPNNKLDVNLVPISHQLLPLPKIYSFFLIAAVISIVIIIVADGFIMYKSYQIQLQAKLQNQKIIERIALINKLKDKEAQAAKLLEDIKQIEGILNQHVYWTNFFKALEDNTLPNVYYKNLAAKSDGVITMSAVTTDYLSLAKQLLIFQNNADFIKEVDILSATKSFIQNEENGEASIPVVNFSINLTINPKVFLQPLIYE